MRHVTFALLLASFACSIQASDWPQWFGANHDGASDEKISTTWPTGGPKVTWKVAIGEGLGTPAVVGDKVYIMAETKGPPGAAAKAKGSERGGEESVVCLDAKTGKQLWAAPVGPTILFEHSGNDGPRSTPAVVNGHIYAVGTYLNIACFDAATGKPVWAHDCEKEFGGGVQLKTGGISAWGCANSPVIDGNLLFVHCGGAGSALMAFDIKTGNVAWKTGTEDLTHCTPTVATIHGKRQVIFFTKKGLVSLETETGKELWRYPFRWNVSTAISPVVGGDIVYCSAGYSVGGGACKITKEGDTFKAIEAWADQKMPSHWSTPVYHDGYLYGLIGFKEFGKEPLKCIEMATGKVMWSQAGFGQGGTAFVDGKILILGDMGQVVLCEASEKGYKEVAKTQAFELAAPTGKGLEKTWNQAVVSGGHLYARSTKGVVCLDVSAK